MTASNALYEKGLQLAQRNDLEGALACIQEYLVSCPRDGEALNDAGTILSALGRHEPAVEHLRRAVEVTGDPRCLVNLAEACLAADQPAEAMDLFARLYADGLLTPEFVNRTAQTFLVRDDIGGAIEALLASRAAWPEQEVLTPMLTNLRHLRPRVAFFCDSKQFTFLQDIYNFTADRYETHVCTDYSPEGMASLLAWCDIAFFEWATQQVVTATMLPKTCKIVVRLHRYEAYLPTIDQIRWENVDDLITVGNSAVMDHLRSRVGDIERKTRVHVIPNGVDVARFPLVDRPRGKNLVALANIRPVKNHPLLLQCFHALYQQDPEYRLFFAGQWADETLRQYLPHMAKELGLADAVRFDGFIEPAAVPAYLADKHYLLLGSVIEGHNCSLLEGMATGLKPVIHAFPGAASLYPKEFLWRTPAEFCRLVTETSYTPREYRAYVEQGFSLERQLRSVDALLCRLESQGPPTWRGRLARGCDSSARTTEEDKPVPCTNADGPPSSRGGQAFYDQFWSANSPAGSAMRGTENAWERARHDKVIGALRSMTRGRLAMLDFGCGRGLMARRLAEFGDVTGVDWSASGIESARANCPGGTFLCGSFFDVHLPAEAFDVVTSIEVIEHLETSDQLRYLELARRCLKPSGLLLLTTPNRPIARALNEHFRQAHGKGWSEQPIENWLDAAGLLDLVRTAGLTMRTMETILDADGAIGIHLWLAAYKQA
ncbi:MAG: methyltransferase domain-containing protein [Phycisphaerae bacterium]|nr:methyltransferase domain-containing protein [Phycisphaerae bacterium]